jgi:quinol monooxygenase YgiN
MIGVVATITVKDGKGPEFEAVAKQLVAAVRANEPGCKLYALHKGEQPNTYVFMERYEDEAALAAHRETTHFKEIGGRMGPFMAGRPAVMRMPEVV